MSDLSTDISPQLNSIVDWAHRKMDDGIDQYEDILRKVCDKISIVAMEAPLLIKHGRPPVLNAQARMEKIAETVSVAVGIPLDRIRGRGQTSAVVEARRVAVYVTRKATRLSFIEIGHYFGRDHSTMVYSCRTVQRDMKADIAFKYRVEMLIHGAA